MCRIFGFRSVLFSKVHSSLVSAENALMQQGRRNPDGWGLAYYIEDTPHLVKSLDSAETDELFRRVSGIVSSQTVLAHVRRATQGKLSLINTHPFQYGRWTFAHNGNIRSFELHEEHIIKRVTKDLLRWRLGDTDSELIFKFLLTRLAEHVDLASPAPNVKTCMQALGAATKELTDLIGPLSPKETGVPTENYLTYVISNGPILIGMQGGLTLHYSTHKKRCPERDTCSSFAPLCEAPAKAGDQVNHLILSSEPLQGENIWVKMAPGDMIGIDAQMRLHQQHVLLPLDQEVNPAAS